MLQNNLNTQQILKMVFLGGLIQQKYKTKFEILINSMWPTFKKQPGKSQSKEDLFSYSRSNMGLGQVKYRLAVPVQNRMNPSHRFWRYANDGTKSLSKDNTEERRSSQPWKKVAHELNTKVQADRRLQIYNTPFSFLSTVGGKITTIKPPEDDVKPVAKTLLTRVKSAKVMPKREFAENDLGIIDDDKGYDLFNAQVQKHYAVPQQKPYLSRPITSKKTQNQSQHIDWTGLRPMTGKSSIRKIQRQQLISAKDKIDNIKSKASNDTTYYSPVEKIGINMQFTALFRYEHLHQLKQGDSQNQKYMPLQYGIRNLSSNTPNTIDVSNQVPITICLFPEYFDPNPIKSAQIRSEYLERILQQMGGTYDPEYYIKLYMEKHPSKTDMKRFMEEMAIIKSDTISPYNHTWIETAVKDFDEGLVNQEVLRKCIREIWSGYQLALREAMVNYRLRNSAEKKRLGIQSVYKYTNNMEKIVVNGGYSRQIHIGWSSYVDSSRKLLTLSLCKYSQVNLAMKYWFADFAKIRMLEFGLASLLSQEGYCMDLEQFLDLQETHFRDREDILRNVWFRGALCIFFKGKYLQTEKISPWKNLLLKQLEDRRLNYHHETNNYYKNRPVAVICQQLYTNFLMMKIPVSGPDGQLVSIGPGFQSPKSSIQHFQKLASSSQQLLCIQLYQVINQNILSFEKFIEDGVASGSPLLRINLSVRNDLLVFNYSRQELLGLFQKLFNHILMMNFQGNDIIEDVHLNPSSTSKYLAYCPYISVKSGSSKQSIKVAWSNTSIFSDRIQNVLTKVLNGYDQCSFVLRKFQHFQSLVRRPDLVFDFLSSEFDEQGYLYSDFLKHAQLLRDYNSKLNDLDDSYSFSLFKVNVAPVKAFLSGKINEMLYLAQKKYKRILFRDILLVEGAANDLNQKLLLCNKTAGELSVAEQLLETVMTTTLPELKDSCNRTIKVMLSYIGTMEPSSGTISVLSVIQSKLTYIYKLPQGIRKLIEGIVEQKHAKERSTLEKGLKSSIQDVQSKITNLRHAINEQIMNFAYLHSKLNNYNDYLVQFQDNVRDIEQNLELLSIDHNLLFREDSAQIVNMQKIFDKESKMGKVLARFWKTVYQFHQYVRTIHKQEVRCLNSSQFEGLIASCNKEVDALSGSLPLKSVYPKYLNTFKEELGPYERAIPLLKLLSTSTLTRAHYCKLPEPKWPTQPIKLLIEQWQQIPDRENSPQLKQIRIVCQASFLQDQVRKTLQKTKETLAQRRLRLGMRKHLEVIEWSEESAELDSISFNVKNAMETVNRILRDSENVMTEEVGELKVEIKSIQTTIEKVRVICDKIANIQRDYVSVEGLFTLEDLPHMVEDMQKFRLIQQIWAEVIKVVVQSPGLSELQSKPTLLIHLNKAEQLLVEVKSALKMSQQKLRQTYPRLYFINKQLLFDTICSYDPERTIQAILQCFPTFGDIEIVTGSVVTVGSKHPITLNPSVGVKSRFTQIELWMQQIETTVRARLLDIFQKMIEMRPVQDAPEQLVILKLWLEFTKLVEQAFANNQLKLLSEQVRSRLNTKNTANLSVCVMLQRDIIDELIHNNVTSANSLEWIKFPRFYLQEGLKPTTRLLDREYEYGFQFLNSMELAITSYQMFGSCLVAPKASGKRTIIKNMAALTAQELWVIQQGDSYERIESVLKGTIQCRLWVAIPHITQLSIEAAALVYQHLTVQKLSQQTSGFGYFLTLDELEIAQCRYEQCIDKLVERPVYLQKPRYSHIIRMYAEILGCAEVASTLEKLVELLEAYGSEHVNMTFIHALRSRLYSLKDKSSREIEQDLYRLLHKVFQGKPQYSLINAFFFKTETSEEKLQIESTIENPNKAQVPINRPIVYYGRDYISRKTTKIKERFGKQSQIIYATRLGVEKTIEVVSSLSTQTIIVFDRSLSLYRSLRQSPSVSRVTTIVFEESTIESLEPDILMECYLNFLEPIEEQVHIPAALANCKSILTAVQGRLKLKQNLGRVRRQFNIILQGLLGYNNDPVCSFVFALIWSYGRECNQHQFYEILRDETNKHRQIHSLLVHHDRLQSLIIEENRLKPINPRPLPLCGGVIEMPSTELSQLLNLSHIVQHNIMFLSDCFLTSYARKLSPYYLACNRHTSGSTFFGQFQYKCLQKTAKTTEYLTKINGNHRVVVDDVHLAALEAQDSLTEIIIQGSLKKCVTSPKLNMLWIIATKAEEVKKSQKLQRLRERMISIGVSKEVTETVYGFFVRGVFRDGGARILEVSKQLEREYKREYPWFCITGYQLASPMYLQNITDCLPSKQRDRIFSLLPQATFCAPTTEPHSPQPLPVQLHSTESLRAHLQKLSQNRPFLRTILLTQQLLNDVLTLSKHILHKQNILLVGGKCCGKSTAVKISALVVGHHLKEAGVGLTPQTRDSAMTIRYIRQHEIQEEVLTHLVKAGEYPGWLVGGGGCRDGSEDSAILVVSVSDPAKYPEWLSEMCVVQVSTPSKTSLLQMVKASLPEKLKKKQNIEVILDKVGVCRNLFIATQFLKAFSDMWIKQNKKIEDMKDLAEKARNRIDSVGPASIQQAEKTLDDLNYKLSLLEQDKKKHDISHNNLTRLHEAQQIKANNMKEAIAAVQSKIATAKENYTQQGVYLQGKITKAQSKISQNADIKLFAKNYVDLVSKLLQKPFESASQIKSLSKMTFKKEQIQLVADCMQSNQNKPSGTTKQLVELITAVSEYSKFRMKQVELTQKLETQQVGLETSRKQYCDTSSMLNDIQASVNQSKKQETVINDRLMAKNKEIQQVNDKIDRIRQLSKQFERYNIANELQDQVKKTTGNILGDTLLTTCLLMGCDESIVKQEIYKENIDVSPNFNIAEMFYSKSKLRKVTAKLGVTLEVLNQVAKMLNNPLCCLVTDKTGNVLRQLPDIIVLLNDKQNSCETVRVPFDYRFGKDGAIKTMKQELKGQSGNKLIFFIQKEGLLSDHRIFRAVKREYSLMEQEANTLGLSFDSSIPVLRNYGIIVGMEEVSSLGAIPQQLEPYILKIQVKTTPKEILSEMQSMIISMRESVIHSSLMILNQSQVELQDNIEQHSAELLQYMKNPSLSLTDYEDVYTIIFGLNDSLFQAKNSLQKVNTKLKQKDSDINEKYAKCLQEAMKVLSAYTFLEDIEVEFKVISQMWLDLFMETVKEIKAIDDHVYFGSVLAKELTRNLYQLVKEEIKDDSKVLVLTYVQLILAGATHKQIVSVLTRSSENKALEISSTIKEYWEYRQLLKWNQFIDKCRECLNSFLSDILKSKTISRRTSNQQDPKGIQNTCSKISSKIQDKKKSMIAFILPYPDINQVLFELQRIHNRRFLFYTPNVEEEQQYDVTLRDSWKRGHWLFIFNIHLYSHFLPKLLYFMSSQKSEPHLDFRVWVTIQPQNASILPYNCCRLISTPLSSPVLKAKDNESLSVKIANRAVQLHQSFEQSSVYRWERKFPLIRHCNLKTFSDYVQRQNLKDKAELIKVWMFSFKSLIINRLDQQRLQCFLENTEYSLGSQPIAAKTELSELLKLENELSRQVLQSWRKLFYLIKSDTNMKNKSTQSQYISDCLEKNITPVNWLSIKHGSPVLCEYLYMMVSQIKSEIQLKSSQSILELQNVFDPTTQLVKLFVKIAKIKGKSLLNTIIKFHQLNGTEFLGDICTVVLPERIKPHMSGRNKCYVQLTNTTEDLTENWNSLIRKLTQLSRRYAIFD